MTIIAQTFKATTLALATVDAIERDASNGRINAALINALSADYGITCPASPTDFIKTVNTGYLNGDKGTDKAATLVQCLHYVGQCLITSGRVKNLPVLAAIPAWASAEGLAATKAARAAKRAASAKIDATSTEAATEAATDAEATSPTMTAAEAIPLTVVQVCEALSTFTQADRDIVQATLNRLASVEPLVFPELETI